MKLSSHGLTIDPALCLAAIPRLIVDAICDNTPRCLAATSSIAIDGQPLALEAGTEPRIKLERGQINFRTLFLC
jgi:hypothetical protein